MARKVSMADVARELNVSKATVSYVLNGREGHYVGESTRNRVLQTAQQMGYRRNRAAQALAGRRSYLIELGVYHFYPSYYARLLDAFDRQLRPTPYDLHIVNLARGDDESHVAPDGDWPVDGIIADTHLSEPMLLPHLQRGVPIVNIGMRYNTDLDHVFVDLMPALLEALRHLAAHGRRVAYAAPPYGGSPPEFPDPRYPAYRQVMQESGLTEEMIVTPESEGETFRPAVRQNVRDYIAQNGCPDAIFCHNDEGAIATLAALRDLKLRVPDDVMLIGCDGIEDTAYHHPAISTIQYPFDEVARLAWEFLSRRIEQPDIPLQSATLTAQLLWRESSAR